MGLNLSQTFFEANSILNENLGKYDSMNLIGSNQDGSLYYLAQGITRGFYYKGTSGKRGEAIETIRVVPENSTIETALKSMVMIELVNLDGTYARFTPESKKLPERPSFQYEFSVKPNHSEKTPIT